MKKQKIKMAAFDLDGTLLTNDKKITEETRRVLLEAEKQGVVLVPATGRPMCGMPKEVLDLPGIRYIVSSNGARIVDQKEGKILHEKLVPYEIAVKLLEVFQKYDTILEVYYDGTGYAEEAKLSHIERYVSDEPMAQYIASTRRPVNDVMAFFKERRQPSDKVQAIFRQMQEMEQALTEIEALKDEIEVTGALHNNIEVNARGVDKGSALLFLGELLGIEREEIIAFGDGANDVSMLQKAGIGIAMENGISKAKEAACRITLTNEENGVAAAMMEYIL